MADVTMVLARLQIAKARLTVEKKRPGGHWMSQPRQPAGRPNGGEWIGAEANGKASAGLTMTPSFAAASGSPFNTAPPDDTQRKALLAYSKEDFSRVNGQLRGLKKKTDAAQKRIQELDSFLENRQIPEEIKVYRGLGAAGVKALMKSGINIGDEFEDPSYASTSRSRRMAWQFAQDNSGGKGKVLIEITVPAGAKGADISKVSNVPEEEEVLLARGTRFRITGWDPPVMAVSVMTDAVRKAAPRPVMIDAAEQTGKFEESGHGLIFVSRGATPINLDDTPTPPTNGGLSALLAKLQIAKAKLRIAKRQPRPLYVRRDLLNGNALIAWAKEQGFKTTVPAGDLHVTVAYSKRPVDWFTMPGAWDDKLTVPEGGARVVERLGIEGSAVVLRFKSPSLQWRWQELRDAGASWDWPDYQPHVTISWDAADLDLEKIEPYTGELRFGPEIYAEIDEDWRADAKAL